MSENLEEYDEVMQRLEEAGIGYGYGENLLDKITTAAVIEELKRILLQFRRGESNAAVVFDRIVELEATL